MNPHISHQAQSQQQKPSQGTLKQFFSGSCKRCFFVTYIHPIGSNIPLISSWWFQPSGKILAKLGIFPNFRGENSKNIWAATTQYIPSYKKPKVFNSQLHNSDPLDDHWVKESIGKLSPQTEDVSTPGCASGEKPRSKDSKTSLKAMVYFSNKTTKNKSE